MASVTAQMGGVDAVDDTMGQIEEGLADANEIADALSRPVAGGMEADEDDLLAELEQLQGGDLEAQVREKPWRHHPGASRHGPVWAANIKHMTMRSLTASQGGRFFSLLDLPTTPELLAVHPCSVADSPLTTCAGSQHRLGGLGDHCAIGPIVEAFACCSHIRACDDGRRARAGRARGVDGDVIDTGVALAHGI
eukprot:scaffold239964_cov33-Tisochrysis_lutea.AAC.3